MPSVRLGFESAPDCLAKARRELKRFKNADEEQDRADHALNLAVTVHHLGAALPLLSISRPDMPQ